MKKKRPRRKANKPPPERRATRRSGPGREAESRRAGPLLYKVVELSAVDEGSLERAINGWVARGWSWDGVQFAMRESSKRPAMAFVFFTREGPLEADEAGRSGEEAREHLARLAGAGPEAAPKGAYERLAQLAGEDELPE